MSLGEKLAGAMETLRRAATLDKDAIKEAVKEIQRALISSDVEVSLVLELSKKIEAEAFKEMPEGFNRKEHAIKATYDLLAELLGGEAAKAPENPKRILLVGTFGHGKTTTAGKVAKWYAKRGKSVGLVAADVFRPAAVEQLRQVAEKAKVEFFGIEGEKSAQKVVEKGLEKFHSKDLVIVDSAGRSALDEELVKEIKEISSALKPDETWLVLGADIGQIAKKQAQAFHDAVGVNGVIITKMDGSAKGGGVLAACHATKASVYFIGVGEKLDDFEEFDAQRYLSRIMGFGDLQALLEKAKELGEDETALSAEEMLEGEFNFKVFYEQLKATKKLGPLSKVAEMLGMKMQVPKEQLEIGQEKMDSFGIIIDSMTEQERKNPELLTRTRIHRIAVGSGRKEEDVRELIKQYRTMEKMFKKFKSIGSEKKLEKMAKSGNFGGMLQGFAKKKKKFRLK